jgi:hypothetical protein
MTKSPIAFALMVAAGLAMAFPTSPPPGQAGGYPVAQASASSQDVTPIAAKELGAAQAVQADRMSAAIGSDLAQADCSTCRTAMHPGRGEREQHPMGRDKGGGKRCIDISYSPRFT